MEQSTEASPKKPGIGSYIEPAVLVALAVVLGTCAGNFAGKQFGRTYFAKEFEAMDPVETGRKEARAAKMDKDERLKKAYGRGLDKGKRDKLKQLEEDMRKLEEKDRYVWNTTIEENAIKSCMSFYMKGINDAEKEYESSFKWEYKVPKCEQGVISTKLSERIQLYHGNIPVGDPYQREISEELWGDCKQMSAHYLEVLDSIRKINTNQNLNWEVEKKEVRITGE